MLKEYQITLPMPPSVNAAYMPVRRGRISEMIKTDEYREWENIYAAAAFRRQYPGGTPCLLKGRLQVQYIYHFNNARAQDVFNREKCLSDFLEGKFFVNDSQIDVGVVYRRINRALTKSHVEVFIKEIADDRWVDMFAPEVT